MVCFFKVFLQGLYARMDLKNRKGLIYTGSFCEGVSPILFCSQILGIFPLKGIRLKPTNMVRFSWFSFGSLICLAFLIWDGIVIFAYIYSNRNSKLNASFITTTIFFSMGFLIYAVFLKLARQWVKIITYWTEKEQPFLKAPYVTKRSKKLKTKLIIIGVTILVSALTEHALFQLSDIYSYIRWGIDCNTTSTRRLDWFFTRDRYPHVHHFIPGMFAMALCQYVTWLATAAWNFLDFFIIVISIGITTRFEQFASALKHHLKHDIPTIISMRTFRMDYIAICELLEYVEKNMGLIVFLSTVNNLYFVCSQILSAFNPLRFLPNYFYSWFSLLYLLSRTLYVFLSAAAINESSQRPKALLQNIPRKHWNEESNRLLFQINTSNIGLSAMGFFSFSRSLILTMAGAIVTLELVLLQFRTTSKSLGAWCG